MYKIIVTTVATYTIDDPSFMIEGNREGRIYPLIYCHIGNYFLVPHGEKQRNVI